MKALISTVRFLLIVDLETRVCEAIENHRTEYYGISWFHGDPNLVLSHSAMRNGDLIDIQSYARSELGYLSKGDRVSPRFLSQPHQIVCAPDGHIITTNTGRNRIQIVHLDEPTKFQELGLSDGRWDRLGVEGPFGDHLNSVFLKDNTLYVIAHRFRSGSILARISYPELEIISATPIPNITGVHNVFADDEGLIIGCHSEIGGLANLKTGEPLWISGSPGYTRGLAVTRDVILVGDSEMTSRADRASSLSGLWVVDRETLQTRDFIHLGPYGAVHEVRILDEPDFAHHGMTFTGDTSAFPRMSSAITTDRLNASKLIKEDRQRWTGWSAALGMATQKPDGMRWADGDELVLYLTKNDQEVAVLYQLESTGSHLSLIAGYNGAGGDTNMYAYLLQRYSDTEASLSLFHHNGESWLNEKEPIAEGLPTQGRFMLQLGTEVVTLAVGDAVFTSPLPAQSGSLGIRAVRAAFRPIGRGDEIIAG